MHGIFLRGFQFCFHFPCSYVEIRLSSENILGPFTNSE